MNTRNESIELWEYKNKEFIVLLYKKLLSELSQLSDDIYQNGTYSKFVKFLYRTSGPCKNLGLTPYGVRSCYE
jgi:hypothetical protein